MNPAKKTQGLPYQGAISNKGAQVTQAAYPQPKASKNIVTRGEDLRTKGGKK